jgi:hypothetical protein
MKMLTLTPYVASLRVYEPSICFEEEHLLIWSKVLSSKTSFVEESKQALIRIIQDQLQDFKSDGAHFLDYKGESFVAPWSTVVRCWAAFNDFKFTLPPSVIKFFIPQTIKDSINGTIDIVEDKVSHILTSNWNIPPRWFALFSPDERSWGVNEGGHFTIMRTAIANAKRRCTFTHKTVLGVFGEGAVEREVAELIAWLEIFDPKSIVELDYGGLATYLNNQLIESGEVGLDADTSIEDVTSSIAGLASGNGAIAGRGYERLVSRWRRVSMLESAT